VSFLVRYSGKGGARRYDDVDGTVQDLGGGDEVFREGRGIGIDLPGGYYVFPP